MAFSNSYAVQVNRLWDKPSRTGSQFHSHSIWKNVAFLAGDFLFTGFWKHLIHLLRDG
jgi:hypothetical protein